MKRVLRSIMCLAMVMVMLFSVTAPVEAASKQKVAVKKLAAKKTAEGIQDEWNRETSTTTRTVYKITIKTPGYITVTNNYYKKDNSSFYIYDHKPTYSDSDWFWWFGGSEYEKSFSIPVDKGTYYIRPTGIYGVDGLKGGSYSFKYTFTKATVTEGNFCAGTATTLKAKKSVLICAPKHYMYNRWYKITLKKSQYLQFTLNDMTKLADNASSTPTVTLYNSKFKSQDTVHKSGFTYSSKEKLPTGTFYIRVNANDSEWKNGYLFKLSWK